MRYLNLLISLFISSMAFAQLNGDGYYRVKSFCTQKYLYLMDDKGSVNVSSASADVAAIVPYPGEDKMISDPASVIYFQSMSNGYKLSGQGVSTTKFLGNNPLVIRQNKDNTYWCYASKSGATLYLADTRTSARYADKPGTLEAITPSQDNEGKEVRKWYIYPVSSTSSNYFGVKPTFSLNGKHYASFYVDFPFSFASSGMKAYTVTKNKKNKAVLTEITSSVIPAQTPVLIECSSENPSDNRLNIGGSASKISTILKGNFFCYDPNPGTVAPHTNLTPYTSSMRVFGVTSDGKLGLITQSGLSNVPANCAYFEASDIDAELALVSEEEFAKEDVIDVASVSLSNNELSLDLNGNVTATLTATIAPENATDKSVTWSSSNEAVVTVSAEGVVTAVAVGEAVITVTSANGKTATCIVKVVDTTPIEVAEVALDKAELSFDLNGNATATLTATIAPENATDKNVTWSSSNEAVATVSAEGVVTAVAVGEAVITVTSANGKTATCQVKVVDTTPIEVAEITLDKAELSLDLNGNATATLTATIAPEDATDKTVTWSSSDETVATVSAEGVVTAIAVGEAVITVTSANGKTATCQVKVIDTTPIEVAEITLDKTELTFDLNEDVKSATLTATIAPEDATDKTLTWSSSDETVATVSAEGVVTAVAVGVATITVTSSNGLTATCLVKVEDNSAVEGITVDANRKNTPIYTIGGQLVGKYIEALGKGIYILNGKKVVLK